MQIIPNKLEDTQLARKLSDTDAMCMGIFKSVTNMWSRKQQAYSEGNQSRRVMKCVQTAKCW